MRSSGRPDLAAGLLLAVQRPAASCNEPADYVWHPGYGGNVGPARTRRRFDAGRVLARARRAVEPRHRDLKRNRIGFLREKPDHGFVGEVIVRGAEARAP